MSLCVLVILLCFGAAAFIFGANLNFGVSSFQFVLDLGDQHLDIFNDAAIVVISKLEVEVSIGIMLWAGLSLRRKKLV